MKAAGAALCAIVLTGCSALRPEPRTIVRVDTVTVTREVAPPLPDGDSVEVCLSTGVPAHVRVSANGDTLIGDARVSLRTLRPTVSFAGVYAVGLGWFEGVDTLRFEKRVYRKLGRPQRRSCDELKRVGDHGGVPIFAEVTAPQPLPQIEVPASPGMFQTYATPVPRRRR